MSKKKIKKLPAGEAARLDAFSFEQSLEQLETIVEELEHPDLPLTEALKKYETGVRYLQHCHRQLRDAEQRIEILAKFDPAGEVETMPFAEPEMDLSEKAAQRSQRRSRS